MNQKYQQVEREVRVRPKSKRRLTVQMDELWSFVDHKGDKQWVWLALDAQTREIVGVQIGNRNRFLQKFKPALITNSVYIGFTDHRRGASFEERRFFPQSSLGWL